MAQVSFSSFFLASIHVFHVSVPVSPFPCRLFMKTNF